MDNTTHAGIYQGNTGVPVLPSLQVLLIVLPGETKIAWIEICELNVGLGLKLLNEVTMPVQARTKSSKGIAGMLDLLKCMLYLPH